ncbi:unnamed protein product [marine sediment metagenome]|uniref:Uncharacterized protein n=1 Tax=marine sediment metagenome TaxID=412755 RepID=X1F1V5_9ZZZZ
MIQDTGNFFVNFCLERVESLKNMKEEIYKEIGRRKGDLFLKHINQMELDIMKISNTNQTNTESLNKALLNEIDFKKLLK